MKVLKSATFQLFVFSILLATLSQNVLNPYQQLILSYVAINVILATSLNLVNGFCGQFSLGHAGFMAVGAYVSGVLSLHVQIFQGPIHFLNFPFYALVGGLAAAVAGWFVGMPSLKLRGDYLAIVTLGFGEIIRVIVLNLDSVGGARGLYGIPGPKGISLKDFGIPFELSSFFVGSTLAFFFAGGTCVVLWRLTRSSFGRAFLSVKEDEVASECMGVNTTQTKVFAFVISSFFAGVGGSLFAHTTNYLNPASFQFMKSVDVVIMVVLGGMGSLTGSVLAAIFVTVLPEALRPLQQYTGVDLRMVIYSLSLILLMILRPQGILGTKEWSDFSPFRKWVGKR
ncbi:branched-chain amino acid ABC transporter permease [bacterium]|nr:branched-chain amino acid ABC transporter permease [bacterium]